MRSSILLVLALLCPTETLHAEKYLGPDAEPTQAGEEAPVLKKKRKKKRVKALPPPEDDVAADESGGDAQGEESGSGHFTLSGGFGSSSGTLSAQVTVGYYFNRYVGIETSYYYYKFDSNGTTGEQYGPEIDAVLRFANPSIVTPYVGAGPGYTKWRRAVRGQVFDSSSAFTSNMFGGVDLRLTPHFGIGIVRKQQVYLSDPPRSYSDPTVREARSTWSTNIGFRLAF